MEQLSMYEKLSAERKELQAKGDLPTFFTTGGWQMWKAKYRYKNESVRESYQRIATTAARHIDVYDGAYEYFKHKFFDILWNGTLGGSTPVLANMGTDRGMPVSCSGQLVGDSIDDFYKSEHELAILTKNGFGTSSYLGDIRPRGSSISVGGNASGVLDVITSYVDVMRKVAQGTARRGAWAGYIPMDHGDFDEVIDYFEHNHDDLNLGWVVTDEFVARLQSGDMKASKAVARALKVKLVTGKGYFFFVDKVNRARPQMYKDLDLKVLASNLCTEINLFSDIDHTFTCVLSSMNLATYDKWKHTNAVFIATIFLDCVAQEFIERAKGKSGFEKAVRFTEKSRALGLGVAGLHTLFQKRNLPFESLEAHLLNNEVFKHLQEESLKASQWMALKLGEPEWCKGYGVRNTHRTAVAPTTTNALICGGVSHGIEPIVANVYAQPTSAGVMERVNPVFLELAQNRGKWDTDLLKYLSRNKGSVQQLDWLTDHEKLVFKTAYEIDQMVILRMAAARQPRLCQGQSLNGFFDADTPEEVILAYHKEIFLNEQLFASYYLRTAAGVDASTGECMVCQ